MLTFTSFFCLRRLLVALATVLFNETLIIFIFVKVFSTLLFTKYMMDSKPMETPIQNKIEIGNEINMLAFSYFMFIFTAFIPDIKMRFTLGYVFMFFISFVFVVNVALISSSMYYDALMKYKKDKKDEAWKEFNQLKDKMALWIVINGSNKRWHHFGMLVTSKEIRKRKFRILRKYSYKMMVDIIIKAVERKKNESVPVRR